MKKAEIAGRLSGQSRMSREAAGEGLDFIFEVLAEAHGRQTGSADRRLWFPGNDGSPR